MYFTITEEKIKNTWSKYIFLKQYAYDIKMAG